MLFNSSQQKPLINWSCSSFETLREQCTSINKCIVLPLKWDIQDEFKYILFEITFDFFFILIINYTQDTASTKCGRGNSFRVT